MWNSGRITQSRTVGLSGINICQDFGKRAQRIRFFTHPSVVTNTYQHQQLRYNRLQKQTEASDPSSLTKSVHASEIINNYELLQTNDHSTLHADQVIQYHLYGGKYVYRGINGQAQFQTFIIIRRGSVDIIMHLSLTVSALTFKGRTIEIVGDPYIVQNFRQNKLKVGSSCCRVSKRSSHECVGQIILILILDNPCRVAV